MIEKTSSALKASARLFGSLARDQRGVAAIEFAFIAPILLCMYLMTMEVSQGIETNKKLGRAGSMVGDLVTQQSTITKSELDGIMQIGNSLLQPYDRSQPAITVTAIQISSDNPPRATVLWSRKMSNAVFSAGATKGTAVKVPTSLLVGGTFLLRVDAAMTYLPVIIYKADQKAALGLKSAFDSIPMNETYYMRPRMSTTVPCTDC